MPLIRKDTVGAPLPDPVDTAALLDTGSADQRWAAARRLGDLPGGVGHLGRALETETDERVREAIFTSLARHGTPAGIDAVLPHLRSNDANLRSGALDALRVMIGALRPRLPSLLADPDPDLRLLVCDLTRELPSAEASALLCAVLARDTEPNVCAAAADVLAEIGDRNALPFLARCAARFPEEAFLTFALGIAAERIVAQRAGPHE